MSGLAPVEWGECILERRPDPELEGWVRRELGVVPDFVPFLTPAPWLVRSLVRHSFFREVLVEIDFDLAELVWLAVSLDNSCRYCYDTHRALLRLSGIAEERLRQLEEDGFRAHADPRTRLAADFGRRLSRFRPPPDAEDLARLREGGFSEDAIREVAFVASLAVAANRVATVAALPPDPAEDLPDRWYVRPFRGLIARWLRGRIRRGRREALPPAAHAGPFEWAVTWFGDLPAARILRESIDDAFASPLLLARSKWWVHAVVARALGCAIAEAEARRHLTGEEGFTAETFDAVLRHLGAPGLDPVDAVLVPFARETVWYSTGRVQQRARELLVPRLDPAQLVEAIGVVGMANRLCRLGALARV